MNVSERYARLFHDVPRSADVYCPRDTVNKLSSYETLPEDVDVERRELVTTITTQTVDRDADVVLTEGLNLDAIDPAKPGANPVVLFMHDRFAPPIAKGLWIHRQKTRVKARVKFAPSPFAQEIFTLYAEGFLRQWSIGMDYSTLRAHRPTPDEVKARPVWAKAERVIDYAEVIEFSAVTIAANPEAMCKALDSGKFPHVQPKVEAWLDRLERRQQRAVKRHLTTGICRLNYPQTRRLIRV